MDREALRSFVKTAEAALMSARGSLLLISQGGAKFDLAPISAQLANISEIAAPLGYTSLASQAARCQDTITNATAPERAVLALDAIAAVEAELLTIVLPEEIGDVAEFVDDSFDEILHEGGPVDACPEFAIDDETREIFRSEAEELLGVISMRIDMLAASPGDQNALWDIRRCSHTFKGAAGIVGLSEAASLSHRMEDLLDRLVESHGTASTAVCDFLRGCVRSLNAVLDEHPANAAGLEIAYSSAVASLNGKPSKENIPQQKADTAHEKPADNKRVARVSLDRISEIVALAEQLLTSHIELDQDARKAVINIHDQLKRLRLIKFGNLETRFARAVNITSDEEHKRAVLEIETPDVEIDTLVLDALVEPMLHLIKNAVVHGIEPPDVRRMLGKHEFGLITIGVEADDEAVVVTVTDDGAGIAVDKLKQRAIAKHLVSRHNADKMSDRDAYKLLFDKGLSTTDAVTLNAGRGVGMSIVKDAVEARGGNIHIESTQQLGTTFILMLPVQLALSTTHVNGPSASAELVSSPHVSETSVAPTPAVQLSDSTPPLILIVDDSPSIRRHTQKIVDAAGCRTITAKDGADALELLLNGTVEPDLILSDVEMPHMDGFALLEYLKTDDHLGHLPVVLVTSLDADKHRALATKLGAADYIVKPFAKEHVERVMELLAENVVA